MHNTNSQGATSEAQMEGKEVSVETSLGELVYLCIVFSSIFTRSPCTTP